MQRSQTNSSDYYDEDDSGFLGALQATMLPGDLVIEEPLDEIQDELPLEPPPATQSSLKRRSAMVVDQSPERSQSSSLEPPPPWQPRQRDLYTSAVEDVITEESSQELEPPPATQPSLKRQRLEAFEERERLANNPQDDDIYGASRFGGFGEYMRRKRAKLQIQNAALRPTDDASGSGIFKGLSIYVSINFLL
jgi:DNA repair protein REV1